MSAPSRDVIRRLYLTPPDGFVAARTAAVADARAAGDAVTAREIAKLRKPTVAAWLVNLLALNRPDLIAVLVSLGTQLRTAQRELRGPQLRELGARRREVIGALVHEARVLAGRAEQGPPPGKLPLAEVEATLEAALADPEITEQVRSGRLVRAVSYAGFGEVPRPQLRLVHGGAGAAKRAEAEVEPKDRVGARRPVSEGVGRADNRVVRAERAEQVRVLRQELRRARTEQKRAEAELARVAAAERDGAAALAKLEASLAELERARAAAEQEADRRKLARKAAERDVAAARRRVGEVEAAVERIDRESTAGERGGGAGSG